MKSGSLFIRTSVGHYMTFKDNKALLFEIVENTFKSEWLTITLKFIIYPQKNPPAGGFLFLLY